MTSTPRSEETPTPRRSGRPPPRLTPEDRIDYLLPEAYRACTYRNLMHYRPTTSQPIESKGYSANVSCTAFSETLRVRRW
jgi:hypothetical protein